MVRKTVLLDIFLLYIAGIPFDDDALQLNINAFKFRKTIQDVSSLSHALASAVLIPVLFLSLSWLFLFSYAVYKTEINGREDPLR
jgi:hypothetical protein